MTHYIVGIIPVDGTVRDEYPLVQSRCHYKVLDVYTIAEVVQDYYSSATLNRDVEYVFPLPPSAAVCSFKAVIDDDKVIKGIVKEKGEAKKGYNEAVAQGKTAGLLQQEHADVFRVSLGNIKPKQKISVHISFVSIIPHDGSSPQSLRITMPTAIAPRYGAAPTSIPWFGKNDGNCFELTVSVQMSKPITSVSSPSHPIGLTLGCAEKELTGDYEPSKAFVYLSTSTFLDNDIVIVISAQGLDAPRCTAERWLSSEGAEETTDAYALTLVPKFDLPALPSQEYIFLVDRSGSMRGGRIEAVKTGLQIMLRSLPSRNTTFNIVSFGSRFTSLWPTSQMYSAETVEEASKHVDTFKANYSGTELRSALQFAFSSRQALAPNSTEKPPASVFVLTDGEAWDLDGIINLVTENVEAAKRQDSLLRAFVLGVGNQVSTAMCEGIARAGKGSTVFVAEGEKPDAKLMSLLKAARGGVIEDLTVDWGSEEVSKEPEDDFELISKAEAAAPQKELPPLSLFDEEMALGDTAETGPQKIIVQLPPTPVIQQAPKSDKLPIPLYPGFRCSIFAIIKQVANPGPHSPSIKITGRVLGREVAFQVPVTPISLDAKTTEGGKLLHTLAAKALIQTYEDMPSSAETKAQIERLGKRYSLASSVTSFLAIDHDSSSELRPSPLVQVEIVPDPFQRKTSGVRTRTTAYRSPSPQPPMQQQQMQALVLQMAMPAQQQLQEQAICFIPSSLPSPDPAPLANYSMSAGSLGHPQGFTVPDSSSSTFEREREAVRRPSRAALLVEPVHQSAAPARKSSSMNKERAVAAAAAAAPYPAPRGKPKRRVNSVRKQESGLSENEDDDASFVEPLYQSAAAAAPYPDPHNIPRGRVNSSRKRKSGFVEYDYSPVSSLVLGAGVDQPASSSAPPPAGPLTLEFIARAQKFDGSFPHDSAFLAQVCSDKPVPALPDALADVMGDANVKEIIWATVLVLTFLKRVFAGEKDSWEMMAEKATMFVEEALMDMGADSGLFASLIALA